MDSVRAGAEGVSEGEARSRHDSLEDGRALSPHSRDLSIMRTRVIARGLGLPVS